MKKKPHDKSHAIEQRLARANKRCEVLQTRLDCLHVVLSVLNERLDLAQRPWYTRAYLWTRGHVLRAYSWIRSDIRNSIL